ncbi:hypothetical protein [Endozoicomonas lisbonensis]|uniref:hypothetical protein n=1 Tax=Endozoicomonas lisbonensis TaxID=3120522 RepID=UPI003395E1FB
MTWWFPFPMQASTVAFSHCPIRVVLLSSCFSYGLPHLIHIRGVIPWGLELPEVDANEARWQQSTTTYQGYDKDGNWHKVGKIHQNIAAIKQIMKSPRTWVGSDSENVLQILIDFMEETAAALDTIAGHTHSGGPKPDQGGDISGKSSAIKEINNGRLKPITE